MSIRSAKIAAIAALGVAVLLPVDSAHAFRCGNKIVRDGMHEQQVIAACGDPTSIRFLGHALRAFDFRSRIHRGRGIYHRHPGFSNFVSEVVVTEYIYNFGPRKLMRRLIFEGSVLVEIETIGYGYIEKKDD